MRVSLVIVLVAGLAACAAAAHARVIGELAQVGFRVQAGYGYRVGEWLPVLVRLRVEGADLFSGTLRFEQMDIDGDRCAIETPVSLSPDSPEAREFWLYCPVSQDERESITLRLLDDAGNATPILGEDGNVRMALTSSNLPVMVGSEHTLVLDISEQAVPALTRIDGDETPLMFPPEVATCPPSRLPDRWYGLEMVDIIVWNRPDVGTMTPDQIDALREWTRRGGMFVIAVGRHTDASKLVGLESMLPATIAGTYAVTEKNDSLARFMGAEAEAAFDPPLTFAHLVPRSGMHAQFEHALGDDKVADADDTGLVSEEAFDEAAVAADDGLEKRPLVVRGRFGFGEVVMISADLLDVGRVSSEADARRTYKAMLRFRQFPSKPQQAFNFNATDLFPYVRTVIDFGTLAGAYLIIAFVFIVAYILGSTVATWHFLQKRKWSHHNWSAFAIAAIVASAISVSAVQAVRGVGASAAQLSIVDAVAGNSEAQARCFFGIKTATHSALDIWLPSDPLGDEAEQQNPCKLKPIPPALFAIENPFSDPQRYRARPERARLDNVEIRATLKQFEGRWLGHLDGTLAAEIRMASAAATPQGWIENRLPVDLEQCELFITGAPPQPALRDQSILVLHLGNLRAGERVDLERRIAEFNGFKDGRLDRESTRLASRYGSWSRHYRLMGNLAGGSDGPKSVDSDTVTDTLLMLSVFNELEPKSVSAEFATDFARSRMRDIDLSNDLYPDQAFIIGYTRDAGPARICTRPAGSDRDFRPIHPRHARTMYRFAVPIERN